jgi:hypothetical protein
MNILMNWQLYAVGGGYVVFMAAVGAMEAPTESSHPVYRWAYKFLNQLAVNVTAVRNTIPKA